MPRAEASCRGVEETGDKPEGIGLAMGGVAIVFAGLGTILVRKRPENPVPWIYLWIAVYLSLQGAAEQYAFYGLVTNPGRLPGAIWMGWLAQMGGGTVFFTPLVFFFLLFPTGRLPSRRWRPFAYASLATMLFIGALDGLSAVRLRMAPGYSNPFGVEWINDLRRALELPMVLAVLFLVAGAAFSLVVRFRRSRGEERQQLKWFTAAASLLGAFILSAPLIWTGVIPAPGWVWPAMLASGLIALPVASAFAMLRYRLYDIDVVINRTIVYGLLSAVLAGVYVALVFGFQTLLAPFTAESDLAIAASTLAVAGLFRPARSRVQGFIDRRFYRRKVDAERTLDEFSSSLRDEVDLDALSSELTRVVGETMQPSHVTLWLRSGVQA